MNPSPSPKQEFVFERDTGIVFQHPRPSEQPLKLRKTQFTVIPRLESVNAEAYNKQFEEMRKSMPKNLAYSGRFGTPDLTPPAVAPKPAPKKTVQPPAADETETSKVQLPPASKPVLQTKPLSETTTPVSPPPPPKPEPKPEPKKQEPVKDDEPIQFYTGYEPDPFSNDAYQNQEMIIQEHNKKKVSAESFASKFKKTFKKLFAADAEDEYEEV